MRCGCRFVKQGAGVDKRLANTHPRLCWTNGRRAEYKRGLPWKCICLRL